MVVFEKVYFLVATWALFLVFSLLPCTESGTTNTQPTLSTASTTATKTTTTPAASPTTTAPASTSPAGGTTSPKTNAVTVSTAKSTTTTNASFFDDITMVATLFTVVGCVIVCGVIGVIIAFVYKPAQLAARAKVAPLG